MNRMNRRTEPSTNLYPPQNIAMHQMSQNAVYPQHIFQSTPTGPTVVYNLHQTVPTNSTSIILFI